MSNQSNSKEIYWREVEVACRLVLEAGKILLDFYERDTKVSYKAGDEPVTEADLAASDHILSGLREAFPDDVLVSEEEPDHPNRQTSPRHWLIDPLDGTKEFIARNGEFSIMVGLVVDTYPVVGVVYQPTEDRLWWGASGQAFLHTKGVQSALHTSNVSEYSEMRMVVSRSHRNAIVDEMAARLGITREITSGSGGIKLGLIAGGEAEVLFSPTPYTKIWDMCAPEAILRAAGGEVTDFSGHRLNYCGEELFNLNGVLASNAQRHQDLLRDLEGLYVPPQ